MAVSRLHWSVAVLLLLSIAGCSSRPSKHTDTQTSPATAKSNTVSNVHNPAELVTTPNHVLPFKMTNPTSAQDHFDIAVYDDVHKQPSAAIAEYEKALLLSPQWAVAHFRVAKDYANSGRTYDAIAHWTTAIQYDPQFVDAYDELAGAYASEGRLREAIKTYSQLLRYPVPQMGIRYQLAVWYEELGDKKNARRNLERYRALALKDDPEEQKSERFQFAPRELGKLNQGR